MSPVDRAPRGPRAPRGRRRASGALGLALAVVVASLAVSCSDGEGAGGAAGDHPNILFVVTDDMAVGDLAAMPLLAEWLGDEGTSFTRAYVSVSLCCPSRATMLRGQYAHNTGVLSNEGTNGGFPVAHQLGIEASTVATWLQGAGYRTGLVGKYLNYYPLGAGTTYVPPGWDDWVSPVAGSTESGFDYTLNDNGRLVRYGDDPDDYSAHVLVDRAAALATRAAAADQPFFTWLAVDAPHEPATPAPQDADAFAGERAPRTEAFDRVDESAPDWVRDLPALTRAQKDEIDDRHRSRWASLRSLDRELARLARVLDDNGQLDDTYVVLISDNGFHLGQHRLKAGKQSAFEEDVRVPLLVRGPGVPAGATSSALVANVDLAPTFAALAGVEVPGFVDGRSLADLFHGEAEGADRTAVLLEHWPADVPLADVVDASPAGASTTDTSTTDTSRPDDSPADDPPADTSQGGGSTADSSTADASTPGTSPAGDGTEGPPVIATGSLDPEARGEGPTPPEFAGVRTDRYTYVEYVTGEIELYDNESDPAQINNLAASAPPALLDRLAGLVDELRDCAGASCRAAEERSVP